MTLSGGTPETLTHRGRTRILVLLCLAVLACTGCSEKRKVIADIRSTFSQDNYEETILLCERAFRKDIRDGEVYYYYGLSLLGLGRDYESYRRFEEAVDVDPLWAGKIAEKLLEKGGDAHERGERRKAAERLKFAANLYPPLELGSLKYLVAEAYFEERGFDRAAIMYREALSERPDTTVAEKAYYNLAQCYVAMGDSTGALDALEELLARFPKGGLAGQAEWRLVNILYEHAKSEFTRGNYVTVVEEIDDLLRRTDNNSLVQRARFLLGEAYERMEDYTSAYEQYRTIIDKDRGASGRIVERAREKINALRDSGLL